MTQKITRSHIPIFKRNMSSSEDFLRKLMRKNNKITHVILKIVTFNFPGLMFNKFTDCATNSKDNLDHLLSKLFKTILKPIKEPALRNNRLNWRKKLCCLSFVPLNFFGIFKW